MKKLTPLQTVKAEHGSKADLINKLADRLERFDGEDKSDFRERLSRVSNKKLLRLHATQARLEADFGTKDKLVDAVLTQKIAAQKNDADFRKKLQSLPTTRLLDMHDNWSGR